jgi:threonine synthase
MVETRVKNMKLGVLTRYRERLPLTTKTPIFTLGEGDTPLVRCGNLEKIIGVGELYLKLEGCNPTGSFKDRGMVVAVAKAVESGSRMVMCASTGNTSASAAAYAAYLGLDCIIIIPAGHIALGKLAQAIIYGAKIISLKGNFDQALSMVRDLTSKHPVSLVNSINPDRIEGQKTAAFEIIDQLGDAPDYLCIPVGNAGNITAYWQGFKEYHSLGRAKIKPQMMGYQAEGAAPIVRGYPIENPETIASAIRIGNPASWQKAVAARDESGGRIDMVSDTEILAAYHLMASKEGIFGEPASAASVAGLIKMARLGVKLSEKRVVCVITGNGLKDVDVALKDVSGAFTEVPAEEKAVERALGW